MDERVLQRAFGSLLCIFNTYWSSAFIVLVHLYQLSRREFGGILKLVSLVLSTLSET